MPDALNKICSQFNWAKRSLIFIHVGLEQGLIGFIYRPFVPQASSDQIDTFIEKGGLRLGGLFEPQGSLGLLQALR